ncbi:hypothetical protein C8R43DRAFT_992172 [Mycena crocata]|nr:hypothetical protein C8R43DRAFT_992172 [Mycena crocata]
MEAPQKRKVTVKVTEPTQNRTYATRSPSPFKSYSNSPAPSPTFRPKAKVNSSATSNLVARKATSVVSGSAVSRTASVRSAASSSTARTGVSVTPRSGSPSKQPPSAPRARAAITRGVTATRTGPQEPRRQSFTNDASRNSAPSSVADILDLSDDGEDSPVPSPRITAKLSKQSSNESPSSPPLLPHGSLRAGQPHRARVPSISSNASSSASSPFHPNSAAANIHRFPSARPSPPPPAQHHYQPFPRDDVTAKYARTNGFSAKVDPATIPLPPHSPPTSAVSFSSRSSLSGPSSVSYATESGTSQLSAPRQSNGRDSDSNMRSGLENLMNLSGMLPPAEDDEDDDDDSDSDERQDLRRALPNGRSEQRQNLEITNRSLLTINTSLEQTKHRQAKEIRELRRKLRESRLILPPRAFRAVKSSLDHDDTADEDDDEPEEEEEEEVAEKAREEHDIMYRRIKVILEGLLESGRRALETTPQDFPEPVKVAKVLSAYEVMSDDDEPRDTAGSKIPVSPSHVAVPDSDDDFRSEDEVEAMTLPRDSPPPSHPPSPQPPPIRVSEPA